MIRMNNLLTNALACLLFISCQQDELFTDSSYGSKAIIFSSDYITSRTTNLRDGFQQGDKVGILGYCKDYDGGRATLPWETKKNACLPDVFYNQQLTYSSDGIWSYQYKGEDEIGGLKPWEKNEESRYTFFAYYPWAEIQQSGVGSNTSYTGTISVDGRNMGQISLPGWSIIGGNDYSNCGDPEITYTLPFSGTDDQTERDYTLVPDVMVASRIDHRPMDGSVVNLSFNHLLCSMEFRICNYNLNNNEQGGKDGQVILKALSLRGNGFYRSITKTGEVTSVTENNTYSGTFNLRTTDLTCEAATMKDGITTPSETWITDNEGKRLQLLFIPDSEGRITSSNNSCNIILSDSEGSNNRSITLGNTIRFKPGVRNIFTINYIGNDVILQVTSTEHWEDGGDSDIEFE